MSNSNHIEEQITYPNKINSESKNQEDGLERSESEILRIKYEKEINLNKALDLMYKSKRSYQGFIMDIQDRNFVNEQLNQFKFFQDIIQKCRIKTFSDICLEHLNIEIFTEGNILFHKGDSIDKIYIIANGEVVIYSDKSNKELLQDQANFKKNKLKSTSAYDKIFLKKNIRKLEYISQGVLTVKNTNKLRVGDYFGDSRWPKEQKVIQDSVYVACQNLKAITIYKDIFENLIDLALDEKSKKKLSFFKQLLPSSPLLHLVQFIHYVKEKSYKYKEFIFQENEPSPKYLYVINDGEVTIQIHPSEELKKQYRTKVELAILSKFEVFGDEPLLGISRRTDAQCRIKQGASVYYFKAKDLKKQSDLNEYILKLLERNSKLKSEFQQSHLEQIKMMNEEMEKQNELFFKKKETIIDQILTEITTNTQKKTNKNMGLYVDQTIVEQTYDVVPKSVEDKKFFSRTNVFTSHDSKQKQSTIDIDFHKRTRLFSSLSQRQSSLNNSYDNCQSINASLNNKIYNIIQAKNHLEVDNNHNNTSQLTTDNTRNNSQIFRNHFIQNSQTTLSTNSIAQVFDSNQQQNSISLFINNLHRRKSQSVFISHGLKESIFQEQNDEEVLNNFSSIEKMRNVKITNYNKLCDTQRILDVKEKSNSPKNLQQDCQKEEQIVKSQKSLIINTPPSQQKCSQSPSRKSTISPFLTNQQLRQQQLSQNQSYLSNQKHTKYPFMIRMQHIYDKMRIEDQSLDKFNSIQTSRTENQQSAAKQRYIKSQTSGQRSKEPTLYHHQIVSANQSPTNIQFRQINDKNFSNIKNSFFTKKQQNKLKNLIFSGDNLQNQEENNQKSKEIANIFKQSYQLDQNDLPLLNLYRIQHKQSIKHHSEQKSKSQQPKKRIPNVNLIKKIDKEDKFLPTFYLDYSFM
ncbi:cyclic nucleotide-binding domain protein (macronuclear) [Tetrahymena thermophila SB210]|uniref:Cyclic nucleotide-binding domain protein n=1 Tax=Tetrahymena thermophila (strain SB210) TaxID=312017 RepID=I7LXN7_TETTS|nr:cyclic nucleotide-binding domain protein [Tetrahymena thermophila SB210]EAS04998.2 cyclic nucleotide-binding domain protein [Tetrahymena thermophila SB210]|eukprot:XP_001025243.2 cyclic nucleotide-binding domain protein [Tetrahymena thermophila SB210]